MEPRSQRATTTMTRSTSEEAVRTFMEGEDGGTEIATLRISTGFMGPLEML